MYNGTVVYYYLVETLDVLWECCILPLGGYAGCIMGLLYITTRWRHLMYYGSVVYYH